MSSIFTKIINGEIPSFKVAESDLFYAFLDIRPLAKGHTLVVPKKEIDYFFDIGDEELKNMIIFSKRLAICIQEVIPCNRVGMAVLGLEVPHAHVHLVPLNSIDDLNFSNPKLDLNQEEMIEIAQSIYKSFIKQTH
ncbi:MAG: HIT family protein [Saprospiraceae bacterium]|nr:HIT family protein [Saprospiraceae bacterium]